jgi:predicted secreted hydrolase
MRSRLLHLIVSALSLCASCIHGAETPLTTKDGFAVPQPGYRFSFPRDHGSHPEFKLEWWYLTGHLFSKDGRRFGYQATFFRSAAPDHSTQLYLAHMAVVDVKRGIFYHQERLNRAGWDAEAATDNLEVRNGPWRLTMNDATTERMQLQGGVHADVMFQLTLTPKKPRVIFGEDGVSRKGAAPTAASHYITFTRLGTTGTLKMGPQEIPVTGESWMDHEISSSQLTPEQVGWDWLSIQLRDDREIMLYRLRLRDGSADPASTLTWIEADGSLQKQDFTWEVLERWQSPQTGANYPSLVRLKTTDPKTSQPIELTIRPLVADQELTGQLGGIPYWEGACRVTDGYGMEVGAAYMELTGYAKALKLQ